MADKNMEAQISVEFEEATSRQSLNSGETINTLWGKVKRWLSDLKAVAFSGSYNDLSDKPTTATTDTDGLMGAADKVKLDNADNTYALKSKYGDTTINVGRKAGTDVGVRSTAEGYGNTANGNYSHAEGEFTTASGGYSHAEGIHTTASGEMSHAEGNNTTASGANSHTEGSFTTASGISSHAEGDGTTASGNCSHVGGTGTKALHDNEVAYGKYNESKDDTVFSVGDGTSDSARHNAFEITTTGGKLHDKDIATTDMSLPANGGNADTVDGRHCGRIATLDSNGNYWSSKAEDINDAYLQWDGSNYFRLKTYGGNLTHVDDSDTVDGLHADDFVNATDKGQIQIPNNVDVPSWIYANGKRFQRYMTNGDNIGLINVPDNSTDYVWYWYDGLNILARAYASGKYYICDMINGSFSGWKDIYTSGYKPYISGSATVAANSTTCVSNHGFMPSAVIWWDGSLSGVAVSFSDTQFTIDKTSSVDRTINYLIFK